MKYIIIEIVRKNKKDKWHSRIKAPNGEIMWSGEEYENGYSAIERTIRNFIKLVIPNHYKIKIVEGKNVKKVYPKN